MGAHGHAIGVDFGTSTSLVAARAGRQPVEIVPLGQSTRCFPSVAGYRSGALIIGEDADNLPGNEVIRSPKRAITKELATLPVAGGDAPADDVIIAILAEIAKRADAAGRALTRDHELRLGCPAMWDGTQRRRLL